MAYLRGQGEWLAVLIHTSSMRAAPDECAPTAKRRYDEATIAGGMLATCSPRIAIPIRFCYSRKLHAEQCPNIS